MGDLDQKIITIINQYLQQLNIAGLKIVLTVVRRMANGTKHRKEA